jgi:hypothetical protein
MGKPIAIIQDHPDASGRHVCHALADEYAKGTEDGGHEVKRIDVPGWTFRSSGRRSNLKKVRSPYHLDLRRRPSVGLII